MVKGESKKLTITVLNKTTGLPVDCSGATGIMIGCYHDGNKVVGKWSLVSKPGFGAIDVTGAATGELIVYLSPAQTLEAIRQKNMKAEVVVSFNNPAYPSSKQISIDTDIAIQEVEHSIFEGVDPTI